MTLREEIKKVIQDNLEEIKESGEFFFAFDSYELNITDYEEAGIFKVILYPREKCVTNWGKPLYLNNLKI